MFLNETLKTVMKSRVTQTVGNLRGTVAVCSTVFRCTDWLFGCELRTDSPGPVQDQVAAGLYNDGELKYAMNGEFRLLCL